MLCMMYRFVVGGAAWEEEDEEACHDGEGQGRRRGQGPPSPATGSHAGGRPREARRLGETIAKGHNYELMLNFQSPTRHQGV